MWLELTLTLYPLKETEGRDLFKIVESRHKRNSTIFCSQFDIGVAGETVWPASGRHHLQPDRPRHLHGSDWRQGAHTQAKVSARYLTPTIFMIHWQICSVHIQSERRNCSIQSVPLLNLSGTTAQFRRSRWFPPAAYAFTAQNTKMSGSDVATTDPK